MLASRPAALPSVLLVLVAILFWILNPTFLTAMNISGILAFVPELGLIALGMTMLLTAGQFDLSVGAIFGFTPLMVFTMVNNMGMPLPLAVVLWLLVAAVIGFINGYVVTKFGISSFLVTLSTQLMIGGVGLYESNGFPQSTLNSTSWMKPLFNGSIQFGGVKLYISLLWFLVIAAALWYTLNQTRFGNWITATGGNRDAAAARGIRTDWTTIKLFMLSALLAGFAGIISDIRVGSAYPTAGTGYELQVIAIAVVGGTLLTGGSGTIVGTVVGAMLLAVIQNGVILAGVPGLAYQMFVGAVILVALILQTGVLRLRRGTS
ncbi:ABC transporter permease [Planosporangium thailandense]|uniref:ABC transporter permease n=1 Tax=Planosporangium thailandense TaxID=765197 RepID=A0ABX0Y6H1_9ACTN|nr:ABC transporter permease [Planosporangium thailandense]NJC72909.1 ABC transporter permease [Planosporangium thailandense]